MAAVADMNTMSWESLQMGGDGKFSVQMAGCNGKQDEQVTLQMGSDGKVQAVGFDGRVKGAFDIVTPLDHDDPTAKDLANFAAKKNNVKFEKLVLGFKVNVVFGSVYCIILTGKDGNKSHSYFTAVHKSAFNKTVLYFTRVPYT